MRLACISRGSNKASCDGVPDTDTRGADQSRLAGHGSPRRRGVLDTVRTNRSHGGVILFEQGSDRTFIIL